MSELPEGNIGLERLSVDTRVVVEAFMGAVERGESPGPDFWRRLGIEGLREVVRTMRGMSDEFARLQAADIGLQSAVAALKLSVPGQALLKRGLEAHKNSLEMALDLIVYYHKRATDLEQLVAQMVVKHPEWFQVAPATTEATGA